MMENPLKYFDTRAQKSTTQLKGEYLSTSTISSVFSKEVILSCVDSRVHPSIWCSKFKSYKNYKGV